VRNGTDLKSMRSSVGPLHGYLRAENLNRFSFCLGMHRFRQMSAISAAKLNEAANDSLGLEDPGRRGHASQADFWTVSRDCGQVSTRPDNFRVRRDLGGTGMCFVD
jgi:hypothetical protein